VSVAEQKIVIVVPVFNDGPSLVELTRRLGVALGDRWADTALVVVDDGSFPAIDEKFLDSLNGTATGCIVTLTRNVGHQRALAMGISYAVDGALADTLVAMDSDGEDDPADVPRLLAAIDEHPSAIVVAERTKRSESLAFRVCYGLYRLMFALLTGRRIRFGNFMGLPLLAARRIANMGELWLSLPATILLSRVPIISVPTERGVRFHGKSKMNFVSLVVHGLRAMAVFVEHVLTRIILGALALLSLCILASAIAIVQKFIGMATPGWVTTVVGLSLVILVTTVVLCFVSLAISIVVGAQPIAPPLAAFRAQIDRVTPIGPKPHRTGDEVTSTPPGNAPQPAPIR
jgi:hypothetical protein